MVEKAPLAALTAGIERRLPAWVELLVLSERYCHLPTGALLRTRRGLGAFERLAPRGRWTHVVGGAGVAATVLAAAVGILTVIRFGLSSLQTAAPSFAHDPGNMVVVPGVNDIMPFSAAGAILLALLIVGVSHELGHGVMARAVGIDVESWGVFLVGVLPLGAFVEPVDGAVDDARPLARVYFAVGGVLANLAVAIPTGLAHAALVAPERIAAALTSPASLPALLAAQSAVANVLFWTWFLAVNVALVNALPIRGLDGGHVLRAGWDALTAAVPPVARPLPTGRVLHGSTVLLLGAFVTGMVVPWLRVWGWV